MNLIQNENKLKIYESLASAAEISPVLSIARNTLAALDSDLSSDRIKLSSFRTLATEATELFSCRNLLVIIKCDS